MNKNPGMCGRQLVAGVKSLIVAALVSLVCLTGAHAALPAEAFGTRAAISDVQISPDGKHIAALRWVEGSVALSIIDLQATSAADRMQTVSLDVDKKRDEKVERFVWFNNDRLGVFFEFEAMRGTTPVIETRLLGVDIGLGKVQQIPKQVSESRGGKRGLKVKEQIQTTVVDYLPNDPDHILMSLRRDGLGSPSVYKVNVYTGDVDRVFRGASNVVWYETDQQGRVRIKYLTYSNRQNTEVLKREILLLSESGDSSYVLTTAQGGERYDFVPLSFTSDPNILWVSKTGDSGFSEIHKYDVLKRSLTGKVLSMPGVDIDNVRTDRHNGTIVGAWYAVDQHEMMYADSEIADVQAAMDAALPGVGNTITSWDKARNIFVISSSGPRHPGRYFLFNKAQNKLQLLMAKFPAKIPPQELQEMKRISYKARDGYEIPAYLTLPEGSGPYPFVVLPHGGPTARDYLGWDHWVQFLASRGYAVLQPQFRGSDGFGSAHREAGGAREWGGLMQDDVTDGVKAMVKSGVADPDRMCIFGWSYGGYTALMGAIKTPDLFKCAVSGAGPTDLPRIIREQRDYGGADNDIRNLGGIFEDARLLTETSPISNVDAITIPILLVHGDKDLSVRIGHSKVMAKALKKAGKPHRLIIYKNGNHHLQLERHRVAFLKDLEAFLAEHIGN